MKINVKVIGDIHLGKKDDKALWKELQEIFIPTITEDLDLLVIPGDLFDRVIKLNEITSQYAFRFMDQLTTLSKAYDFKIRILKGTRSHDYNQLDNFKNYETDESFGIANEACVEEIFPGIIALYIPEEYVEDADIYYEEFFKNKYDLVFFHGTMDFAGFAGHLASNKTTKQAPTFSSKQIAALAYGPIVGAHIHIRDNYKMKIYYTGSFTRFNFGEPEEKGFIDYSYDSETHAYDVKYTDNTLAPDYMTVKLADLTGSLEEKLQKIELLKEEYTNLRIDVKEEDKKGNESMIEALKDLTDDNVKLKVANSFEEKYDAKFEFVLKKTLPLDKTIQKFIKLTKNKDITVDEINNILKPDQQ